ncbi:GntR family transcriptional regulator [Teichococcus vastitatis]|uniref:GntR family transcriptional regulator n=1 Tax=Teichococcus vastitatis TaxID=2307076 RepID=A0ABS9W8W4_9PROT|nr:GntR family transcriptional regulator [Pseudoroseomonas vastitatis]MCI0755350.1 GntR family transcriptional regulator [Pseudoroseomonas vastitatis]
MRASHPRNGRGGGRRECRGKDNATLHGPLLPKLKVRTFYIDTILFHVTLVNRNLDRSIGGMPSSVTEPRYASLAREIAQEIAGGRHPIGSQMPPETELAAERGVSRATMRAALDRLELLGLISRRRRAGTRVAALQPTNRSAYSQSLAGIGDLLQYAAETRREITGFEDVVADEALDRTLGLRAGRHWLRITFLRIPAAGGPALCWTEVHGDAEAAPPGLEASLRGPDAGELVATVLANWAGRPIAEVVQEISAAGIPANGVAEALGVQAGDHALRITRRYLDPTGAPLAVSVSLHPADRFTYVTRLRRSVRSTTE